MAELVILAGVGLLGYTLSGKEARPPPDTQPVPRHMHAYPWGPGTEVHKAQAAERQTTQALWEQSLQPSRTGVVTPHTKPGALQPFFRSAKTQHTNDEIKQRTLENFTGMTDAKTSQTGTFVKKKEVGAMFKPEWTAGLVNSGGRNASTPYGIDQSQRFIASNKLNNVVPTQQIRVGPGVGVGPNVAASDGFHPMLRIMPKNVNEHRLNNLPGGVVHGSSAIAARPSEMQLLQYGPPRFWTQERRPTAATKASVNARTHRPTVLLGACGGRPVHGDHFGGVGGQVGTYVQHTQATRDRYDNNVNMHETNVTAAQHGIGAYTKASHDTSRIDNQQREQAQTYDGVLTGHRAARSSEAYLLPQTNRNLHSAELSGNPASSIEGGRARPQDRLDRTLREHVHVPSQLGVATPYLKGHSVQATDKWLDRESKRYGQHLVGWMSPAHKPTDVRMPGLVQVTPRVQLAEAPSLPTMLNPPRMAPMGQSTTTYNKLPTENLRLDLDLAKRQLGNNPLTVSIS